MIDTRDVFAICDRHAVALDNTGPDNKPEPGDWFQQLLRMVLLKRASRFNLEDCQLVSSNAAEPSSILYLQYFP